MSLEFLGGLEKAAQNPFYHRLSTDDSSSASFGSWEWMCKVSQIVISGPFPSICIWLLLHLTAYLLFHMSCLCFDESTKVIRIKSKYIFEMSAPEHCLDMVSKFLSKLFSKNSIFFLNCACWSRHLLLWLSARAFGFYKTRSSSEAAAQLFVLVCSLCLSSWPKKGNILPIKTSFKMKKKKRKQSKSRACSLLGNYPFVVKGR